MQEFFHLARLCEGDIDGAVAMAVYDYDRLELPIHFLESLVPDPEPWVRDKAIAAGENPKPPHDALLSAPSADQEAK
jgi:hypothetical protein